jgi:sugar phosphate isomerase/epimerase
VDQYAEFTMLARAYGQKAIIEFLPLSAVKTIGGAGWIVGASGAEAGGILVDSLHWIRSGGNVANIPASSPSMIHGVQICDGFRDLPNEGLNWWEEMSFGRSFLGEGDFPVREMLTVLPIELPIGIEVVSSQFQNLGLGADAMAQYAFQNACCCLLSRERALTDYG